VTVLQNQINQIWTEMEAEKGDLVERSREYARWTIPSVMSTETDRRSELMKGSVEIGASVVNHLANRIIDVLFPVARPFFTVVLSDDVQLKLDTEMGNQGAGDFREAVHESMRKIENRAMTQMKLSTYRPMAIEVAKHLIITGNTLIKRKKNGSRIQYGIDRYGVRRTNEGVVHEVVLYDKKKLRAFSKHMKALITSVHPGLKDEDDLDLHTHYLWDQGRWLIRQEADGVMLDNQHRQSKKDFDLIVLVWTLPAGDHYGRGLVEDKAVTMHKLDVLGEAETELMAILADIKFLVKPNSVLATRLPELLDSERGSYHVGNEGDITVPQWGKQFDLSVISAAIDKSEARLKDAFLMSSVRDAERVTAEEIRMVANQLESSFGGLYSRLSVQWQQPEAELALEASNWRKLVKDVEMFDVIVTTGVESLSREGQTDNLRMAIGDMQMLDTVPDEIRAAFHPLRFAKFVSANRSVNVMDFLKTQDEMDADAQRQAQAEAAAVQGQANAAAQGKVQEHAGKSAIDNA